jgi:ribonuclease D
MGNTYTTTDLLIQQEDQLLQLIEELRGSRWLALDTEFLRERTYRPKLCLLQIATPKRVACVDPLSPDLDMSPLMDLIYEPAITKVLHGASQDLEIFYWMRGRVPANVFDTQIAAPLLGHVEQISYADLVRERLGVELEKAHTRDDWTRRPMPEQQLRYAADDVIYLAQIYPELRRKLSTLGRLQWLNDDWTALTRAELYERPADQMWQRIRGVDRLGREARAIAQDLATWRELTARERNLPRTWLLKDRVVLDLAKMAPADGRALQRVPGVGKTTARRYGKRLLQVIEEGRGREPSAGRVRSRRSKLTAAQEASVKLLAEAASLHAAECGIAPALLAPRKALEALVRGEEDCAILRGWRGHLVGRKLKRMLESEAAPHVADGEV